MLAWKAIFRTCSFFFSLRVKKKHLYGKEDCVHLFLINSNRRRDKLHSNASANKGCNFMLIGRVLEL